MRWRPLLKQVAKPENKEDEMNQRMQERVDEYYTAKEQIVAHDITKLKQAHMKLREMGDILGIETQALEI